MSLFNLKKSKDKKASKETPEEKGNIYTNIFEKKKNKEPEAKPEIITGVFAKKEAETADKENILGPLPELDRKIVGAFDPSKRNLKIIRTVFIAVLVLSLVTIGFFYAELNPKFDLLASLRGPNTAQRLANSETEIVALQTSINQKNYLLLNYYLQELSYLADTYSKARNDLIAIEDLMGQQNNILVTYENAQSKWEEPIAVANIPQETFENELKAKFKAELKQLQKEDPSPTVTEQINDYVATNTLIGNARLKGFFNKSTDEIQKDLPRDDSKLLVLTQEALAILQNDFSIINDIKENRTAWSGIVAEIEKITKSVDTLYNTGFFEELGGIQYSAYDLDSANGTIILSGRAKRDDGSTFSLIANLIDALEQSAMFEKVDNRSYPKSGSDAEGYVSTFRVELSLKDDYVF